MASHKMRAVPAALLDRSKVSVIKLGPNVPRAFDGSGPDNLHCGGCGKVLCQGMHRGQLSNIFIECHCGTLNDVNV